MIVINPEDTTHTAVVIPRYYDSELNDFIIYDEDTRESSTLSNIKTISNGYASYEFDLNTAEGKSYSIKIMDGNTVIWRGKMFATSQNKQKYKINV